MLSTNDLNVTNVSKTFGGLVAVRSLSFEVSSNAITSIVGANGAGKTTLFNMISGFERPTEGSIHFKGRRIDGMRPDVIARLGLGRLFQEVRIFKKLTALENTLVALPEFSGSSLRQVVRWQNPRHRRHAIAKAEYLLDQVGLSDRGSARAEDLSYGQQKLLALGRLLAADSDFLLLDEPTSGLSSTMIKKILEIIRSLIDQGRTALIIEHDMKVVKEISDWIHFLSDGKLLCSGPPDLVLNDEAVRQTYLLL
jgi:ABC-type branched-subunit amino acid transport system ATPase component